METYLVRLKPFEPRRGYVLKRFTYAGIKFHGERGWYRVEKPVAEYLRAVRTVADEAHSPLAFDVCTEAEARAMEASEADSAKEKRSALDDIKVAPARATASGILTTGDLPKPSTSVPTAMPKEEERESRRGKRERE